MTRTDLEQTERSLDVIRYSGILKPDGTIGLHSCNGEQRIVVAKAFPQANLKTLNIEDWDITTGNHGHFDLLCFFNVFHYIADPVRAFANVFNSCRYLLVQDLIVRNRSINILADDGDSVRYSFGIIKSNFDGAFDLSVMMNRMVFFTPYIEDGKSLHFISLMKGNL